MLKIENLSFAYDNKKIISNLNFENFEKENILILAESESGKTTFANLLFALIKGEGRISFENKLVNNTCELLDSMTYVMQQCHDYIITTKIEDELAYPLESLAYEPRIIKEKVESIAREWNLDLNKNTSRLSGGQTKKLMIATALITEPKLVVFDESFDDLDIENRNKLASEIKQKKYSSIVLAAHYIPEFNFLFDKIYILKNGFLKESKPNDFLFKNVNLCLNQTENTHHLKCKNIELNRKGFILKCPSFEIKSGEIVSLCGLNGSGKSTFSLFLSGLLKAEMGSIILDEKEASVSELNKNIAYMFQNPDNQIFLPTVKDELMYSFNNEEEVRKIAALFSLNLDSTASLLSYGERKRLQAAIYYLLDRPFYIVDELDSALNYSSVENILNLLLKRGAGILLISHDKDFIKALNSRTYFIENGVLQ